MQQTQEKSYSEETIDRPESGVGSVWSRGRFISNASEERMYKIRINNECKIIPLAVYKQKKKHAHPLKNVTNLHFLLTYV